MGAGSAARVGYINAAADEVIRSVFLNQQRQDIVIASVGSTHGLRWGGEGAPGGESLRGWVVGHGGAAKTGCGGAAG